MPDTPSPAPSSPASLVDVAAARDALDEVLSAENDAVLAQTVSEVRSRLLALREALPGMHAALDRVLSLNADPFALERENDDLRLAVAHREQDAAELRAEVARLQRQTHVECAFMLDMQRQIFEAERRASEAEARATRAERERDTLVRALDEALVTAGELGTFTLGDDPYAALHKLMLWSQTVGEHFAKQAHTPTGETSNG
jgi:predicted  nucleic acid-binding Zn-ribbon protein